MIHKIPTPIGFLIALISIMAFVFSLQAEENAWSVGLMVGLGQSLRKTATYPSTQEHDAYASGTSGSSANIALRQQSETADLYPSTFRERQTHSNIFVERKISNCWAVSFGFSQMAVHEQCVKNCGAIQQAYNGELFMNPRSDQLTRIVALSSAGAPQHPYWIAQSWDIGFTYRFERQGPVVPFAGVGVGIATIDFINTPTLSDGSQWLAGGRAVARNQMEHSFWGRGRPYEII